LKQQISSLQSQISSTEQLLLKNNERNKELEEKNLEYCRKIEELESKSTTTTVSLFSFPNSFIYSFIIYSISFGFI